MPGKGVIVVTRALEDVVRELLAISKGVSKGLVGVILPPAKSQRPKWCQCNKCGGWHYLAK